MRFTIISPLFPPDTAPPALYTKVLLSKLTSTTNSVTGVVYGHIPESVREATIIPVAKRMNVSGRLLQMFKTIRSTVSTTDMYIVCNGPSVEVPFLIAQLITSKPYIFIVNDIQAERTSSQSWWKHTLMVRLKKNAVRTFTIAETITPYCPPEIHPLLPHPTEAVEKFTSLWEIHSKEILDTSYGK